jgi:hypothetical protein
MTSTLFSTAHLCGFLRMQFDGSKPVFLPKHTVPRRKEIKFLRRAQTYIPNKRITSVCAVDSGAIRGAALNVMRLVLRIADYSSNGYRNRRGEGTILNPRLADFDDNEGHVVGEGAVRPCSNAFENCLLHIREW